MTNASTLELKLAVERIVRPINAGWRRKLSMREELLSHLISSYDNVRAHEASEAAAVDSAIQQLGDSEAVRGEYQASVPAYERASTRKFRAVPATWSAWGARRSTESQMRHIGRMALMHGVLCAIVGALWITLALTAWNRDFNSPVFMILVANAIAAFALLSALYVSFIHLVGPRLLDRMHQGKSMARIAYGLLGAISILVPSVLTTFPIAILLANILPWQWVVHNTGILVGITGILPAILGYQFFPASVAEWERLEIGE